MSNGKTQTLYKCDEDSVLTTDSSGNLVCRPIGIDTKTSPPVTFPGGGTPTSASNGRTTSPMMNTFAGPVAAPVLRQTKLLQSDTTNWFVIGGIMLLLGVGLFFTGRYFGKRSGKSKEARR